MLKSVVCRVLRDAIPPTPPGPEGSNGNGPVRVQQVTRCTKVPPMKTTAEIGMKITAAQREFYRYTGVSADIERRGLGAFRIENAWLTRHPSQPRRIAPSSSLNPVS